MTTSRGDLTVRHDGGKDVFRKGTDWEYSVREDSSLLRVDATDSGGNEVTRIYPLSRVLSWGWGQV